KKTIIAICIPPFIAAIIKSKNSYNATKSITGVLIILLTPFAGFMSIFGSLALVAGQEPIPRILTGASATFVYWNVSILILIKSLFKEGDLSNRLAYLLAAQALFFISTPYSFVNAQKKQSTLDVNIAMEAAKDLDYIIG